MSRATGKKQRELVCEAVDLLIERRSRLRRSAILARAAGMWKDRKDLPYPKMLRHQWDRDRCDGRLSLQISAVLLFDILQFVASLTVTVCLDRPTRRGRELSAAPRTGVVGLWLQRKSFACDEPCVSLPYRLFGRPAGCHSAEKRATGKPLDMRSWFPLPLIAGRTPRASPAI